MPFREPAAQIDEVLEKRMIRALVIAEKALFTVRKETGSLFFKWDDDWRGEPIATLAAKIFDKLPNDEG